MDGVGHAKLITCRNGMFFKKKVLVLARQIAESIKVYVVSTKAFVNMFRGDDECVTWCSLVQSVVNDVSTDLRLSHCIICMKNIIDDN